MMDTVHDGLYARDDRHALYVGWVLGMAIRHRLPFEGMCDADGNWTTRVVLRLDPTTTITLVVPPPPDDWTL